MDAIEKIYTAINPLPAMLSATGRVEPRVTVEFEANRQRIYIWLVWKKEHNPSYSGEESRVLCAGDTFDQALQVALKKIKRLPSMKDENTHAFMRDLGKLIDQGRKIDIEVGYLNPLVDTMKRLSDNIITYQPDPADDDMPF